MSKKAKTGKLEEQQHRWITVKFKMLGIFSIMLALLVMFQATNYFLTLRSVQGLKEFYGNTIGHNDALDLKHFLYDKLQALDNYILFPDESHMGQLLYADKAFVKKIDELRSGQQLPGAANRAILLNRIKTLDSSHNQASERLVRVHAQGEAHEAIAAELESVESIEKEMLSNIESIFSTREEIRQDNGNPAGWSRLTDIAISSINPVVKAGIDIHVETGELTDYIKVRNLLLERSIASQRFLISGQNKFVEEFHNYSVELENDINQEILSAHTKKDAVAAALEGAGRTNRLVSAAFDQSVHVYRSGSIEKAKAIHQSAFLDQEMLESTLGDLVDEERGHVTSAFSALTPIMNYALSLSKIMFIYIMLVASLMSAIIYLAVSRMVRPIINLDDAARKIALGDWTQRVAVRSRDEIGRMARSFNKMTDNLERAEAEILKNQLELSALYDVSRAIGRTIDLDILLKEILDTITRVEVLNLERKGSVFIAEGDRLTLASTIGYSTGDPKCQNQINGDECLCSLAVKTGEIIISKNSEEDERHTIKNPGLSPHGHIIVPLKAMDKVVGVLCLYLPAGALVDEDQKTLLYILGAQIGIAIGNAKLYEETKSLSLRDSLTGLANRRLMDIMLEKSFARAQRSGTPFSCIMLDIDYFKKYNDTYGHPAGDSLLNKIAEILLNEVRAIDLVVRYGGEEFFILLPDARLFEAQQAAERIRRAVETGTDVTISLGVASYHREVKTKEYLIKQADEALYQAKKHGRNRVETSISLPRRACG